LAGGLSDRLAASFEKAATGMGIPDGGVAIGMGDTHHERGAG
jgi:hypothetical protein